MQPTATTQGLADLPKVVLDAPRQAMLDAAKGNVGGPAAFQPRVVAEARDILALSQLAPPGRLVVEYLDLSVQLFARLRMRVPVPILTPDPRQPIQVAREAVLRLRYFEEATRLPQAGYQFVQIAEPLGVFHSNVPLVPEQPLCLGPRLPANVRATSLILLSYDALRLAFITLDIFDPVGLFNPVAAHYWQNNADKIPLSRTPFLGRDDEAEGNEK